MRTFPTAALAALGLAAVLVGACGGRGGPAAAPSPVRDGSVELTGTNGILFQPEQVVASSGDLTLELTCEDAVNHNLKIEGVAESEPVVACPAGGTGSGTVSLDPGTYTFYCDVAAHREQGMDGTLTVQGGTPPPSTTSTP